MEKVNPEHIKSNPWIRLAVILSRLVVGATFIFSGFVKAIDPVGSAYKFEDYFAAFGLDFLSPLALYFSVALAAFEFILGINILLGSYIKTTAWLGFLTMCFMTPLTFYLAIADPVKDCGCFGDALVITNWETFFKNLVLLLLVSLLLKYNSRVKSVYNRHVQWLTVLYSLFFACMISWVGSNFLPIIDFRPYKIGTNIPQAMQIPEGAIPNEYEPVFIYEKDGVKKEFALENSPLDDSTWVFVDRIDKLVKKGVEPQITDFLIRSANDEDVTERILENDNYLFLLLSPDLKSASDAEIDKINELYDYCVEYGYDFYSITSSSPEEILEWRDDTGAEYPFFFMDKTTIETIARGNPSVVLLKGGTILWKKGSQSLPDETELTDRLDNLNLGMPVPYDAKERLIYLIFIFVVPMLILLLTEKTVAAVINKIKNYKIRKRKGVNEVSSANPKKDDDADSEKK